MCKKHIILKRDITIGGKPKHNNNYSHLHTQGNEKTRIRRRQIASMRLVFSRVFLAFLHKIAAHFCRSRFHEISYHVDHCLKYEFCENWEIQYYSNLLIEIEILHLWLFFCFCNLPKSWKGSLHYGFSVIYQKVFVKSRIGKIFGKYVVRATANQIQS